MLRLQLKGLNLLDSTIKKPEEIETTVIHHGYDNDFVDELFQ